MKKSPEDLALSLRQVKNLHKDAVVTEIPVVGKHKYYLLEGDKQSVLTEFQFQMMRCFTPEIHYIDYIKIRNLRVGGKSLRSEKYWKKRR